MYVDRACMADLAGAVDLGLSWHWPIPMPRISASEAAEMFFLFFCAYFWSPRISTTVTTMFPPFSKGLVNSLLQ